MRQSIRKYSWTPACDSQLENTPGQPRATVNQKIFLDSVDTVDTVDAVDTVDMVYTVDMTYNE